MINSISIKNFQSHKQTELKLHSGVNVIVGNSKSGKSAIMRSLRWAINNKPSGEAFRSHWGGTTKCLLELKQGTIERVKSEKENKYFFQKEEYKSFGQDVPETIKKVLDFNDINSQFQFDRPFLIFESAGEVAKYLNQIVNLEIIDLSLSKIENERKKINRDITYIQSDITEKEKQIQKYDFIDSVENKIKILENKTAELTKVQKKRSDLYLLIEEYSEKEKQIQKYDFIDGVENKIKVLENKTAELTKVQKKRSDLYLLIEEYSEIKKEKTKLKEKIIDDKKINDLLELNKILEKNKKQKSNIIKIIKEYVEEKMELKKVLHEIDSLEKEEKTITKGLKICPICNRPLNS